MLLWFVYLIMVSSATGQSATTSTNAVVPTLVNYSGTLTEVDGKPLTSLTGVTFYLYENAQGGAPLWMEMQNIQPNKAGRYSVTLGSTTSAGLPVSVFASGEARWLGVQVQGQEEQPRVMLLAVPYALKAGDAETIGGLPPSAFMLATPTIVSGSTTAEPTSTAAPLSAAPAASSNVTTAGGTVNAIPLFTTATNIQNSILTQTAATAVNVAGKLNLPAQGAATATGGKFSRPEDFIASAFNSASAAAVAQTFQLQAEAAGNNTATPFGTLNLLYGSGTTAPAETGFKINNKGVITFATGQTFPGTGKGTITGVVPGSGLSGGGTTGTVTLNLDTTKVPQLQSVNTFTGTERFNGNVGVGGAPSASGFQPLTVTGTTNFGTWLALANSSAGGHTWNIISAGSGNAEGAGNLGITDLTGKSTIWLEGNTNVSGALLVDAQVGPNTPNAAIFAQGPGGTGSGAGSMGTANPNNGLAGDGLVGWGGGGTNGGAAGVTGLGGSAILSDGPGAVFQGGSGSSEGGGDGLEVFAGSGLAGFFVGSIDVTGSISTSGGSFKIDHPLDPANKYLYHSFVESPDMMNIYNGNVVTDGNGDAIVPLPEWFETLNRDFRYQLTVIGQFAQAIVTGEVANHQFSLRTDKPGVKVSWQVTGIRQDSWANAHRIPVEEEKNARERGHYIHPELYGAPEEASIAWARHPEIMKRQQELRKKSLPTRPNAGTR
jgi:hypothetical protein